MGHSIRNHQIFQTFVAQNFRFSSAIYYPWEPYFKLRNPKLHWSTSSSFHRTTFQLVLGAQMTIKRALGAFLDSCSLINIWNNLLMMFFPDSPWWWDLISREFSKNEKFFKSHAVWSACLELTQSNFAHCMDIIMNILGWGHPFVMN